MNKVSLIITVLNEEQSILWLLEAVAGQTVLPYEVIICDGGSHDDTQLLITQFAQTHPHLRIRLIQKKGNRSVGRNAAIAAAQQEIIAVTDAGCIPHKDWLSELLKAKPPEAQDEWVVAGYYDAQPKNAFEAAVVPYVLVMPDKVHPQNFLPATRSMLLTKNAWMKAGRFNELFDDNEDYAFAHKLREQKIPIFFTNSAKVTWIPRHTLRQFFWMIFRFARGDMFAGIVRPKLILIFVRYICLLLLVKFFWPFAIGLFAFYLVWSIQKNSRYVSHAWYWLPVLQIVSDIAVMMGSVVGWWRRLTHHTA